MQRPRAASTLNFQVARLLASLHLRDAALDYVVEVSVAKRTIFTFPVIDGAEEELDFLRFYL